MTKIPYDTVEFDIAERIDGLRHLFDNYLAFASRGNEHTELMKQICVNQANEIAGMISGLGNENFTAIG